MTVTQSISGSVLQVGKFYAPYRGGIESHLELLCKELQRHMRVQVVVSSSTRAGSDEVIDGLDVTRLATTLKVAGASVSPGLSGRIASSRADIVHLHLPNPTAVLAYLSSGRRGRLVATYHSDIVRQKVLGAAFAPFLRQFMQRCDRVIVASPNILESSSVVARVRDRCAVIPYGIDVNAFSSAEGIDSLAVKARFGKRLVLAMGRMVSYKGFEYLIRAMPDIRGRLLLVGDGPLRSELEALALRIGVSDRVTFVGEAHSVAPYYRAADVFVLPSVTRAEAFGIVQLEAMACGTPVVNTALNSGVPFVSRHGETGLTVQPADSGALAAAINRLLDDDELRRTYSLAARRRVESEFSVEAMVERTLDVYRPLLPRARQVFA